MVASARAAFGVAASLTLIVACAGLSPLPESGPTPARGEGIAFRTADGLLLEGTLFRPSERPNMGVVLAHMFPGDQRSWSAVAEELRARGYLVLTFNFRGYGASEGDKDIALIDRDLEAALDFLKDGRAEEVVLVGASMGGTAAVLVAARRDVAGIAALSAPRSFMGLDASEAAARVTEPALFVAAEGDGDAADVARWFAEVVPGPSCAFVARGREHGTDIFKGLQGAELLNVLGGFIKNPEAPAEWNCPSQSGRG